MKAATYCRVSTDEQAQHGTSLDSQRERTRAHVEAQGWTLVAEFVDEGVSGAKESRPALDRLFKACGEGEVEAIIVTVLDRFTRDERLWHNWKHLLASFGVRIVSCDGTVDTSDEESWFTDSVLAAVAAKYRRDFAKRTSAGRRAKAKEGWWVGGPPPFGFRVVDRRLAHDEDEVATLRRACDLVMANRGTLHEVAEQLNTEGRLPRQGNPRWGDRERRIEWDTNKLRYALKQETLVGRFTYGKQAKEQVVNACPRVISDDEWERVQSVLAATKRGVYRRPQTYPLSGRLLSPCGLHYSGIHDVRSGVRYYRCKGREDRPRCSCPYLRADDVDREVWWQIVPLLEDPKRLLAITGLDKEDTDEMRSEQIKALDARIANLSSAITERAAQALVAGLDPTLIAAAVEQLESERDALVQRRVKYEQWEDVQRERKVRRTRIVSLAKEGPKLTRAAMKLASPTRDFQKTLFALLDVKVEAMADGLQIAGVFREDLPELLDVVGSQASGRRASRRT